MRYDTTSAVWSEAVQQQQDHRWPQNHNRGTCEQLQNNLELPPVSANKQSAPYCPADPNPGLEEAGTHNSNSNRFRMMIILAHR